MEIRPSEKPLQVAPFAVHATRGILRDPKARRKMMTLLLLFALTLMAFGLFGTKTWLEPHEHPVRFIVYWFACGWVTLTALLLAILDVLTLRAQARQARQALRSEIKEPSRIERDK